MAARMCARILPDEAPLVHLGASVRDW